MTRPPVGTRASLALQRGVGWALGVIWIPAIAFLLSVVMGYRIRRAPEIRARFRALVRGDDRPILICANHLTMIDSALVAWALGGSWWFLWNYSRMPWNLPEETNFASNPVNRFAAWLVKCIPVVRGGAREEVSAVMDRIRHVLTRGETALVFPEGGRSRSGRVEMESVTYGVGRILGAVPQCRVLCVYLRGEEQESWSTVPTRGDSFYVEMEEFEPESDMEGLRRSRDVSRQIVGKLMEMEEEYFAGRE